MLEMGAVLKRMQLNTMVTTVLIQWVEEPKKRIDLTKTLASHLPML
jgi:hypothetical protein